MKSFAIIGLAGFVAKKHVKCIKNINGKLLAALDKHDNVGFIDKDFSSCVFFKNEKKFFEHIKKKKIDYVVICSPSHLHYIHTIKSLNSNCNVIVEKPPLLNKNNLRHILKIESKTKKKCYCIFQLRLDKSLIKLREKILVSKKIHDVSINYFTLRGDWYFKSWKNKKKLSGGLLVNIGIHFFDILMWIFGEVKEFKIITKSDSTVRGVLKLEKANVKWIVSLKKKHLQEKKIKSNFFRIMKVDKKVYNFNEFNDLHPLNYHEIINKKKFHITQFKDIINLLPILK